VRGARLVAVGLAAISLAACGAPAPAGPTLVVFAAASLTATFTELARGFEVAHPGQSLRLQFDGSTTLARQIAEGAAADVVATADPAVMADLADLVGPVTVFARNELVLATPADNPAGVASLQDLDTPGVTTVACAPAVPCGAIAQRMWRAGGLEVAPASWEPSVTAVVTKLALGEADAGFVYATDLAGTDLVPIELPAPVRAVATTEYPIAVAAASPHQAAASDFVAYVLGEQAQAVLRAAGFGAPS
jgi:molybdate transport system substrate-binding protein